MKKEKNPTTEKDIAKKFQQDMKELATKSGATISIGSSTKKMKVIATPEILEEVIPPMRTKWYSYYQ